jgi:beta-N-acetylhexosaminidase
MVGGQPTRIQQVPPRMTRIGAFISGCAGTILSPAELSFYRETNPLGLILFKRNVESNEQLRALTNSFREAVQRKNAPVFVDQEGGRVQRMGPPNNYWRAYPAAAKFGQLYETNMAQALRAARNAARLMGQDLFEVGITVDCLPVLDVPQPDGSNVIGNRAYATSPERVATLGRAHVAGLMEAGVLPVMKHIPGHGRATVDSHLDLPTVRASRAELEEVDFPPFAAMADLPMAMTAHIIYTAIDPINPATQSAIVIKDIIRDHIGFQGLLISDDLSMKALSGTMGEKTRKSLDAGCDVVLHCNGILHEMREVAAAAGALKGKALNRAKWALKMQRKPLPFDQKMAEIDLGTVLALT